MTYAERITPTRLRRASLTPREYMEPGRHDVPVGYLFRPDDVARDEYTDLAGLAESMETTNGPIHNIIATPRDGRLIIVSGGRRHAAAVMAGIPTLPVEVRPMSEVARLLAMAIENGQRQDLSPLEEGRIYARLTQEGLSQRDIAKKVGKAQSHISKRIALLGLPVEVQDAVRSGEAGLEAVLQPSRNQRTKPNASTPALRVAFAEEIVADRSMDSNDCSLLILQYGLAKASDDAVWRVANALKIEGVTRNNMRSMLSACDAKHRVSVAAALALLDLVGSTSNESWTDSQVAAMRALVRQGYLPTEDEAARLKRSKAAS